MYARRNFQSARARVRGLRVAAAAQSETVAVTKTVQYDCLSTLIAPAGGFVVIRPAWAARLLSYLVVEAARTYDQAEV